MAEFIPTKPQADVHDLLVQALSNNQTWADMADVFNEVMFNNVESPIQQLEEVRAISQKSDEEVLRLTARLLGFDVSQDVLNLNAENLTKIVSQLSHYPDQNGTDNFYKFIDLMLNASTEVWNLYTQDYVNFLRPVNGQSPGPLLEDGGRWFKTTHIELRLFIPKADTLNLGVGQSLFQRVHELFYNFAPVALVIDYTSFVVMFENKDWINAKGEHVAGAFGVTTSLLEGDTYITIE